jgi:hypothetical protein
MFIKYIKELSVKKILKSHLYNVKPTSLTSTIKTVGLLIDESFFDDKVQLIREIVLNGIKENNIKIIVFRDKVRNNEALLDPIFSNKDLNWKGNLKPIFLKDFVNTPFDMLISYYDSEKAPLLLTTHHSKALFKVGFSSIDKRLNHLMINTNAENYKVFTHELFRYLKILNKI